MVDQQSAIDDISMRAVEYLRVQSDSKASTDTDESDELDADWLNTFSRLASTASSDRLRDLWGRILAGELRNPKSFSLATLRMMSEMDMEIASKFQTAVRHRLSQGHIIRKNGLRGQALMDQHFMEEVGLLQGVSSKLSYAMDVDDGQVAVWNRDLALVAASERKVSYPIIRITRIGQEIASILPTENADIPLREIAEIIRPNVKDIYLYPIISQNDSTMNFGDLIETL